MRLNAAIVLGLTLVEALGCHSSTAQSGVSTASASPTSAAIFACGLPTDCLMDSAVDMPAAFPSDFPIYPGTRLTLATVTANFPSNAETTWGMAWETLDSAAGVWEYYRSRLNQGDWTVVLSGRPNGDSSAIFNRRSNASSGGILNVVVVSGVTKIALALTAS
jgi:hypothetical protein